VGARLVPLRAPSLLVPACRSAVRPCAASSLFTTASCRRCFCRAYVYSYHTSPDIRLQRRACCDKSRARFIRHCITPRLDLKRRQPTTTTDRRVPGALLRIRACQLTPSPLLVTTSAIANRILPPRAYRRTSPFVTDDKRTIYLASRKLQPTQDPHCATGADRPTQSNPPHRRPICSFPRSVTNPCEPALDLSGPLLVAIGRAVAA